jgi:hypothetical protein
MPRRSSNASASIKIQRGDLEYWITVEGSYSPGRPPPPCSNHDSPCFSDPGDPPEFDYDKITIDEVLDSEDEPVVRGHALFEELLKPEQIELTQEEDDHLHQILGSSYNYDDGPDPDDY